MSRKLRVFVSSTMRDLANERDAVCRRLSSFNMEPVNAEGWPTTGTGIWDRIAREIESSDVVVLLLGESYGWTPHAGPQSELGLSATHLEYREARKHRIPILPFLKRLSYDSERDSEQAKKRDAFRHEVGEWAQGQYTTEFDLASDLADAVGHALVQLLTDDFLADRIRERAPAADLAIRSLAADDPPRESRAVAIPPALLHALVERRAVLFAGSGISMKAGLPSAAVFAEQLSQVLLGEEPSYSVSPVGSAFAAIASDVEASTSRAVLIDKLEAILKPPQGLQPTLAHERAVDFFDLISTTNGDDLFERAAAAARVDLPVVGSEIAGDLPPRALVKLHGSTAAPDSLLLTETDIAAMDTGRPRLWRAVRDALRTRPLVVVGSSLRDPSIVRLFAEAKPQVGGWFVGPQMFATTQRRLKAWNLECLAADADTFFESLTRAIERWRV